MDATMNLNAKLIPLSETEQHETIGGIWAVVGAALAAAAIGEIISDWDNFKRGLAGKPELK